MPRIVVMSDDGQATLSERVTALDMKTDHFRRCLAERIAWGLDDASELETRAHHEPRRGRLLERGEETVQPRAGERELTPV